MSRDLASLVAVVGKGLCGLLLDRSVLLRISQLSGSDLLALVESSALGLSSLLQSSNDVLVLPANLAGQTTDSAELAAGLETENTESLGNDDLLGLVVGRGDTLEDLEALESSGTTGGLVGDHATDSLVENSGGSAEVEGTTASGVVTGDLSEVGVVLELRTEELARDVKSLTADNNNLLAAQELLGDNGGESAKEVALAIDDDNLLEARHRNRLFWGGIKEKERRAAQILKPVGEDLLFCCAAGVSRPSNVGCKWSR